MEPRQHGALFDRSSRHVRLTEAGRAFPPAEAQSVLDAQNEPSPP
jgi:DNA-binding transcriptional LysR family regulator